MFEVTNLANNPLPLSSGPSLVPRATIKLRTVGDKERSYEARGWMRIIEIRKDAKEPAVDTDPKTPATPKNPEDKSK